MAGTSSGPGLVPAKIVVSPAVKAFLLSATTNFFLLSTSLILSVLLFFLTFVASNNYIVCLQVSHQSQFFILGLYSRHLSSVTRQWIHARALRTPHIHHRQNFQNSPPPQVSDKLDKVIVSLYRLSLTFYRSRLQLLVSPLVFPKASHHGSRRKLALLPNCRIVSSSTDSQQHPTSC